MNCSKCSKEIDENECMVNWGWCDECFDDDYTEYMESKAGPYDWLTISDDNH